MPNSSYGPSPRIELHFPGWGRESEGEPSIVATEAPLVEPVPMTESTLIVPIIVTELTLDDPATRPKPSLDATDPKEKVGN